MSSAVKILPHYTFEDWLHWEGKWELIEGILYAMSPMPVPEHQRISVNISVAFHQSLQTCNSKCRVYQPIDYKISEETILQPDLLLVCGDISKKYLDFPPVLVVEILSPATALKDRHSKFEIYQDQKIKYYLLVDCESQEVEVYEHVDGFLQLKGHGKSFQFKFMIEECIFDIDFGKIWD